jgi:putative ABC transport system substrate-binding protein
VIASRKVNDESGQVASFITVDIETRRKFGKAGRTSPSEVVRRMTARRRILIAAAAWPALVWPVPGFGQGKKPPPLVGVLNSGVRTGPNLTAFREELAGRGWIDGSQVTIEMAHAKGAYDQLPVLAEMLTKKNPAVILAVTTRAVEAAAKAAPRTPVVMVSVNDPVAFGLVASLARPGGMITGVSNIGSDTSSKFVELLIAAAPGVKRIGFLVDARGPGAALMLDSIRRSAAHYSVEASVVEVKHREEIEGGLQRLAMQGMQALASMPSPRLASVRQEILQFAAAQRWPVISNNTGWVRDGALLSYGADTNAQFRRAAYYVDRILRGAKPADLPIELPTTFDMGVNLKTAKALGIKLPPEIMVRATLVIE